jgi:hypothetical protein
LERQGLERLAATKPSPARLSKRAASAGRPKSAPPNAHRRQHAAVRSTPGTRAGNGPPSGLSSRSESQTCAGWDHRRAPELDGVDDLGGIDALQVCARYP